MPKTKLTKIYQHKTIPSPVGILTLVGSDQGLAAVLWEKEKPGRVQIDIGTENKKLPILVEAEKQLAEYFKKKRTTFDIMLDWNGTDFQKKVWRALLTIPFGKTASYKDIAKKIGNPKASRGIGSANARNPICIIAACHRVVGSSGTLTGYAGGLKNKELLLTLEGCEFKK